MSNDNRAAAPCQLEINIPVAPDANARLKESVLSGLETVYRRPFPEVVQK